MDPYGITEKEWAEMAAEVRGEPTADLVEAELFMERMLSLINAELQRRNDLEEAIRVGKVQ